MLERAHQMSSGAPRSALRSYALLALLALLWGLSYNFAKVAVETIPPVTATALRVSIAAIILVLIVRRMGITLWSPRHPWGTLFVQALLLNTIPWTLSAWAARTIDSGLVAILNSTSPIFAFFITWGITRHEPATAMKLIGALAGLAGVVMVIGLSALGSVGDQLVPQLACVFGAVLFGVAAVFGKRLDAMPPLLVATLTLIIGTILLVPASLAFDEPWMLTPSRSSVIALLCLAVFSTAAAVVCYYQILASMGSIAAASQSYLRIVVGVTVGIVFLGEQLTVARFAGMMLILGAVVAMTARERTSIGDRRR
jgi:drug/metabolite transporter (DMT)-like permease